MRVIFRGENPRQAASHRRRGRGVSFAVLAMGLLLTMPASSLAAETTTSRPAKITAASLREAQKSGGCGVAIWLGPVEPAETTEGGGELGERLRAAGWQVRQVPARAETFEEIIEAVRAAVPAPEATERAQSGPAARSRILLAADEAVARDALSLIDSLADRLAGAVLPGASPVRVTPAGLTLWTPRGRARDVPIFVVLDPDPASGANAAVMWRQVQAGNPQSPIHLDLVPAAEAKPESEAARRALRPSEDLEAFLAAAADPERIFDRPDRQQRRLGESARQAATALEPLLGDDGPASEPGPRFDKTDGPFDLSASPPAGWIRAAGLERAYDAETHPFAQMYLRPQEARRPVFVRLLAMPPAGDSPAAETYFDRLRREGWLVVLARRWSAGPIAWQVAAVSYPFGEKWHRWIVLAAGPDAAGEARPLVLGFAAGDDPDLAGLAAGVRAVTATAEVRMRGR